jgi:hypothetical protein
LDTNLDEESKWKAVDKWEKIQWNRKNGLKDEAELYSYPVYLLHRIDTARERILIGHVTVEKIHDEFDVYQDTLFAGSLWVSKINFDEVHKAALKYLPQYAEYDKIGREYHYQVNFIPGRKVPETSYFLLEIREFMCGSAWSPDAEYLRKNQTTKCTIPDALSHKEYRENLYCIQ